MSVEENIKAIGENNRLIGRVEGLKWVLDHIEQGCDADYIEYCIYNHIEGLLEEWEDEHTGADSS